MSLLADELAGWWTLRRIEVLFDDADVRLGPPEAAAGEPGQRRALLKQYLASLNLNQPADHAKLEHVVNDVLEEVFRRPEAGESFDRWVTYLRRDGFAVDTATGRLLSGRHLLTETALSALTDPSAIHDHLRRLGDNVDSDPRLAVSAAKDLVESTAKLVLTARGIPYTRADDLPQLVARAQEALRLSAAGATAGSPEEERALKTILGSLTRLAQGVTELRNKVGVGHGRESVPTWVRPRHARLAAGAAQVWCQLVLETLEDPDAPWRTHPMASSVRDG
jgi:hypothetical protein